MKKIIAVIGLALWLAPAAGRGQALIPQPRQLTPAPGGFVLREGAGIQVQEPAFEGAATYLRNELLARNSLALPARPAGGRAAIAFSREASLGPEAYGLTIGPQGVQIRAATPQGAFYGAVTLLQLARRDTLRGPSLPLPALTISDAPRYSWRGLLLDESRHFFGIEVVKSLLDWMAFYKLNRFHWHLTDSPGWRLAMEAYPRLTAIGGIGSFSEPQAPARYYTQEQVREVVRYAAERHIMVIPEVDMPGHAAAANRAYPVFSGGGSEKHPDFTFNPGKDTTYRFLGRVLRETAVLFPAGMVHIGGDEVHFGNDQWKTDPDIRALMKARGLDSLRAVEQYFIQRMAATVRAMGSRVLLWDEAADTDLPADSTVIFWWRHNRPAQLQKALEKGYPVVLTPRLPLYFDFVQDSTQVAGRRMDTGQPYATLAELYGYPESGRLPIAARQQPQVLGLQGALWTEHIRSLERLEYMLFPRIAALAEAAWTPPARKQPEAFMERLGTHLMFYRKSGLYFYNPFEPRQTPEPVERFQLRTRP